MATFIVGEEYIIDEDVSVVPTPGHTSDDVSVLVKSRQYGIVAVAGVYVPKMLILTLFHTLETIHGVLVCRINVLTEEFG